MIDRTKQHTALGFTLVELLVVIAVIALLAVLMLPTLSSFSRVTNRTTCANNLKRIGESITLFSAGDPGGQKALVNPARWPTQLSEFVGDGGVFICPEGDSELQTAESVPLPDLVSIHVTTTNYDLELIEGPYVAKVSDEQFRAITFQTGKRINAPAYDAGADPTVFWYLLEDVPFERGDLDYDIGIKVTENGDGTVTLSVKQITGAGYDFNLVDKTDNRKILVRKYEMDGSADHEVIVGEGGGGLASYGMNAAFQSILNDPDKIMVMDYAWFVARTTHDWSGEKLKSNIPGIPIFARHHGMINVLFTDGSVRLKRPDEVNPGDPDVQRTLWNE